MGFPKAYVGVRHPSCLPQAAAPAFFLYGGTASAEEVKNVPTQNKL